MNSKFTSCVIFTVSVLLGNCFAAQPALAITKPVTLTRYAALEGESADMPMLFTYIGNPITHFNEKEDGTREYPILLNRAILTNLESGQEIVVMSPEETSATIVHQKTVRSSDSSITLIGFVKELGQRYRTLITIHNDTIRGKIITPDGVVRLSSDLDGDLLIDQRDSNRVPGYLDDDIALPPEPEYMESAYPVKRTAAAGNTTINLMILYSAGYASQYPGDQLAARLNELVAISNTAYSDSGVYITLNLVHTAQVSVSDTLSNNDALDNLTNGVGAFSGISALRTQYGADLVSLIRPYSSSQSGSCGLAWLNGSQGQNISQFADSGYSAVLDGQFSVGSTTYFCSDITLVHELGHNMGCAHDRANASEGTAGDPYDGAYPYSYGYGIDGSFGTIMSYIDPEVNYFSNPDINLCNGQACGVGEGLSASANNALSLNNTRDAVAGFVASPATQIDLDNPDLYKVLTGSSTYTIYTGTSALVYGTSATNSIVLQSGAGAKLRNFIGNNVITIQAASSLFSVSRSGAAVTIEGTEGTILSIPATPTAQSIEFTDLSYTLKINGGVVYLGGQAVNSTPVSL